MNNADLIAQQDQQRTARSFIAFLSSAMGQDQSYAGQDGYSYNLPRQYQTLGPQGLVGVEGAARSNGQLSAVVSPWLLIVAVGAVAYLALRK